MVVHLRRNPNTLLWQYLCEQKHFLHIAALLMAIQDINFLTCVCPLSAHMLSANSQTRRLCSASQLASLLVTLESGATVNIFTSGELALCSITVVTGLFICLRSATKITHKAQSVTSLAAKWHICATINSFDDLDNETPTAQIVSSPVYPVNANWESDDEEGDGDDELDNTKMVPILAHTISYQKRQALVTYFENNRAGITVYGFMLDRTWLHTIFVIQLSLTLWLLNKTIVVTGLFICPRSTTKITHKAESVTSLATKWHIGATINSFDDLDNETPTAQIVSSPIYPVSANWESDDEEGDGDDELDNTKMVPILAHTISYQKRQALGLSG
ncbi:hypothetical protein F0562_018822 [Nyssa sinensis]|uniref:Uncharacterized protein n=1 Tax=Nyssa sinensis TaxID=561372 RepID=A0A5J4ZE27_9ASTE|nr:hypothetical protein F0562_018822 [Nyssa sinensis]